MDSIDHIAVQTESINDSVKWYKKMFSCEVEYEDDSWALLKFENSFFDVVTCISVIEHIGFDNSMYDVIKENKSHKLDKNLYKKAILEMVKNQEKLSIMALRH